MPRRSIGYDVDAGGTSSRLGSGATLRAVDQKIDLLLDRLSFLGSTFNERFTNLDAKVDSLSESYAHLPSNPSHHVESDRRLSDPDDINDNSDVPEINTAPNDTVPKKKKKKTVKNLNNEHPVNREPYLLGLKQLVQQTNETQPEQLGVTDTEERPLTHEQAFGSSAHRSRGLSISQAQDHTPSEQVGNASAAALTPSKIPDVATTSAEGMAPAEQAEVVVNDANTSIGDSGVKVRSDSGNAQKMGDINPGEVVGMVLPQELPEWLEDDLGAVEKQVDEAGNTGQAENGDNNDDAPKDMDSPFNIQFDAPEPEEYQSEVVMTDIPLTQEEREVVNNALPSTPIPGTPVPGTPLPDSEVAAEPEPDVIVVSDGEPDDTQPVVERYSEPMQVDKREEEDKEEQAVVNRSSTHANSVIPVLMDVDAPEELSPRKIIRKRKRTLSNSNVKNTLERENITENGVGTSEVVAVLEEGASSEDDDRELDPEYSPNLFRNSRMSPATGIVSPQRPSKAYRYSQYSIDRESAEKLVRDADEIKARFFYEDCNTSPSEVLRMYKQAADDGGYPLGMIRAAELYLHGAVAVSVGLRRVIPSLPQAEKYLKRALDHPELKEVDNPDCPAWSDRSCALVIQGEFLLQRGNKKDKTEALNNFKEAAQMGNALGQFKVGWIFRDRFANAKSDKTKKENLMKCMKELSKAVEMHSGEAAAVLGSFYENDSKSPLIREVVMQFEGQEMEEAMIMKRAKTLYFLAYEYNCAAGTNDVAACFEVGFADVDQNFDMASELYRKSFQMGWVSAAANLALLYEIGGPNSARIDRREAFYWYEVGHRVYESASLAPKDRPRVIRLFELAIQYAHESNKFVDIIDKATEDLCKILVGCVLLDESNAKDAFRKLKRQPRAKGLRRLEEVRKAASFLAASELNPNLYGNLPSARSAPDKLREWLGETGQDLTNHVTALCSDFRNGRALKEVRDKLLIIVNDPDMQRQLKLFHF